jgi:hypothetical protein
MVTQSLILALGIGAPVVSYTLLRARSRRFDQALLRADDSTALLKAVDRTMNCHDKQKIGMVATLNRIWRKHPGIDDPAQLPVITLDNVRCVYEKWSLSEMAALLHARHVTDKNPRVLGFPIVVIRWRGTNYLVDGRRRINHFIRTNDASSHDILLLELIDSKVQDHDSSCSSPMAFAIAA